MSDVYYTEAGSGVPQPASGYLRFFADSADKLCRTKDTTGFYRNVNPVVNFSTGSQSPSAATRTYITGSNISAPTSKLQIGSCFRWTFNITKTNAGTATSTYDICVGTNGTTGDTARVSFTKPAGTAVPDEGYIIIEAICRGPLSASGVFVGEFVLMHNLSATGHAQIPCVVVNTVSSGFDVTTANLIIGVCITSGASDAITIQQVIARAWNL